MIMVVPLKYKFCLAMTLILALFGFDLTLESRDCLAIISPIAILDILRHPLSLVCQIVPNYSTHVPTLSLFFPAAKSNTYLHNPQTEYIHTM